MSIKRILKGIALRNFTSLRDGAPSAPVFMAGEEEEEEETQHSEFRQLYSASVWYATCCAFSFIQQEMKIHSNVIEYLSVGRWEEIDAQTESLILK